MYHRLVVLCCCLALVSCVTPTPLAAADLSSLLVLTGDLPEGYSPAQVRDQVPAIELAIEGLPEPSSQVYQQFERDGKDGGEVWVLLYDDTENATTAYQLYLSSDMATARRLLRPSPEETDLYGDQAFIWGLISGGRGMSAAFRRCNAVVYIRLVDIANDEAMIAYAQNLDKRLSPEICKAP